MRLCLDEHYSNEIAAHLRELGHDVVSVTERAELRSLDDAALWTQLQVERRALLTEYVADFIALVKRAAERGDAHWGVVFSNPRSMPRGSGTIGAFVEALGELLRASQGEDAFRDRVEWLQRE